jgi:putative tryptophan/tyrosine transport system ATP-binding protein
MHMLKLESLRKTFFSDALQANAVLNGLSLEVLDGEFIALLGPNGCGKSTLLNAIAGSVLVDEGSIMMQGMDITQWSQHRRAEHISRVFQNPLQGTVGSMTIEENLALAARRGQTRSLSQARSAVSREEFREHLRPLGLGLEDRMWMQAGALSGGQRQVLSMVMATLVQPKLLLLDEHTAALDPKSAELVLRLTRDIVARSRITTLMVTHSMHDAVMLGDRLILLHRGNVLYDFQGAEKKRLRVPDLLARFEEIRQMEQLDESAADMLREQYR